MAAQFVMKELWKIIEKIEHLSLLAESTTDTDIKSVIIRKIANVGGYEVSHYQEWTLY